MLKTGTNLWLQLTRPHQSITDIEQRRQSHLLAEILLTTLIVVPIGLILVWVYSNEDTSLISTNIAAVILFGTHGEGI